MKHLICAQKKVITQIIILEYFFFKNYIRQTRFYYSHYETLVDLNVLMTKKCLWRFKKNLYLGKQIADMAK